MIESRELRIGNLVYSGSRIYSIYSGTEIGYKDCDNNRYNPIPLTEEWLLKFGFNTYSDTWYYYKDWSSKHDTFKIAKDEFNNFFMVGYHSKSFKYVHSLQNLYFALTNEELTIN